LSEYVIRIFAWPIGFPKGFGAIAVFLDVTQSGKAGTKQDEEILRPRPQDDARIAKPVMLSPQAKNLISSSDQQFGHEIMTTLRTID
jgi:hypothetical protein